MKLMMLFLSLAFFALTRYSLINREFGLGSERNRDMVSLCIKRMDGTAPPSTGWKPVIILIYDTRLGVGGRLGFCITNKERALLQIVNFTSLPETRLVSRFTSRCSTTCVSSPYPAICQKDYSVTPLSRPSPQQIYYNGYGFTCQPPCRKYFQQSYNVLAP